MKDCTSYQNKRNIDFSLSISAVTAYHGEYSAGPNTDVIVGDAPAIIRDRIVVSQPNAFLGDIQLIQSELSKLSNLGLVTVSAENEVPDEFLQCSWEVTFEGKAGDVPSLQVAPSGSNSFSTSATLEGGDVITVENDLVKGTSQPISGDFTLEFNGQRTPYLPHDVTANEMRTALSGLGSIGDVHVDRIGPDVNSCFSWLVTFIEQIGDLPLLIADYTDLQGTAPSISTTELTEGFEPPFDGPDYGSILISDTSMSTAVVEGLKQGIYYFVRVAASNALGEGQAIFTLPPFIRPMPQPPSPPDNVALEIINGSSVEVTLEAPKRTGGGTISTYKVAYAKEPFVLEHQKLSLSCDPSPEIQRVTTSAADLNEIQYIIIDSNYQGNGIIDEIQEVVCDATGGEFGLEFMGETSYIAFDADEEEIRLALESLMVIDTISVALEDDTSSACVSGGGRFTITFQSLNGVGGDLPPMRAITNQLEGARRVDIAVLVEGDAPPMGSFTLYFRGSTSNPINVSQSQSALKENVEDELLALDTIGSSSVVVNYVSLPNGGPEIMFAVEFTGAGVGGDVPSMEIIANDQHVYGTSAGVFVISDGQEIVARNGIDSVTGQVGNALTGSFQLRLRGHMSDPIPFDASSDRMKAMLEVMPNVGTVDVSRSPPTKERGYSWTITFLSSPGYFPIMTKNVDLLEPINYLETLRDGDSSSDILVEVLTEGDDNLRGQFTLTFDDGSFQHTTAPLDSFISALDLKDELESLPNIGLVSVARSEVDLGYVWDIEFSGCALKESQDVCNDGDLALLQAASVDLSGCGGAMLSVDEIVPGSEEGLCPLLDGNLCSYVECALSPWQLPAQAHHSRS